MRSLKPNHRLKRGIGIEQPRSFSETARELLRWQRNEFTGRVFQTSNMEGKEEIKRSFAPKDGAEDNPERLVRIMDFLTSKMKIDDGGQLRKMLSESRKKGSVSILPTDEKLPPPDILRKLLTGEYNKRLDASQIADRGQAYTLALYLYMHTSGDSDEEMTKTLTRLIEDYDDPRTNLYEYGIDGLRAESSLALLCSKVIEKHNLGDAMRKKLKIMLGTDDQEE